MRNQKELRSLFDQGVRVIVDTATGRRYDLVESCIGLVHEIYRETPEQARRREIQSLVERIERDSARLVELTGRKP